ncbi:Calcium-binding EF-hand family protein [Raphanus sativus]|nr:Calcium-binding EF-hand family protein [Raphanus sativus]
MQIKGEKAYKRFWSMVQGVPSGMDTICWFRSNAYDQNKSGQKKETRHKSLKMGNTSSMLTQYDIEEVQSHCQDLFEQQEILSLYQRFCQLDRNAKGFISSDEFLSVPEFAMNPLSQRLLKMVDGLNFKDFVAFLSAFSAKASLKQKVKLIFQVYDSDGNGKVSFKDIMEVLRDLSGTFMSDEQREQVLSQVLKEAGYTNDSFLTLEDFIKVFGSGKPEMDVEIPVD